MRSLKTTGIALILMSLTVGALAIGMPIRNSVEGQHELSTEIMRGIFEDWTVHVSQNTVFIPMDEYLPNPFDFEDLQIDMPVMIEGYPQPGNQYFAEVVFVFSSRNQAAQKKTQPENHNESLFGIVSLVEFNNMVFHVAVDGHCGEFMEVMVLPDAEFWDAPIGQPRIPLPGAFDLFPGDPVMIHGFQFHDLYRGSVFVRSNDWFPDAGALDGGEIMEVYGWVDHVFYRHGYQYVSIWVDTVTGDPNHQTFTKTVGPEGGIVNFPWGYLNFPPGALDDYEEIIITGDFMFLWTLQNIYEFYPDMEFNQPVEIEIRYFNLDNIDPELIKLVYFDEVDQRWRLACHMTHVPEEHCFRGYVEHFSRYSLSTNNRPLQGVVLQPN